MRQEIDLLRSLPLDWLLKIAMAVVCGAIIGIERQLRRKTAGMRTNVMICLGATLYVLAAELITLRLGAGGMDPSRIAGQVVVGMGFIGAGAIIQSRGQVHGLTTAATMWVVAAIGVLVGLGFPLVALLVTLLVVGLLEGVRHFEHLVLGRCKSIVTTLSFREQPATWQRIDHILEAHNRTRHGLIIQTKTINGEPICFVQLTYCYVHPDHADFLLDLLKIPDIRQTTFQH